MGKSRSSFLLAQVGLSNSALNGQRKPKSKPVTLEGCNVDCRHGTTGPKGRRSVPPKKGDPSQNPAKSPSEETNFASTWGSHTNGWYSLSRDPTSTPKKHTHTHPFRIDPNKLVTGESKKSSKKRKHIFWCGRCMKIGRTFPIPKD